ncbi:MAG TPA: hypothetical protein VM073_06615 [Usitatibacter sp.]|nr:hypothetical protein [Usitatibacter sp.]
MTAESWIRLALVPAAVWLASLAARRWGHGISGYLGGMPLIGGPITLFLALDHGADFAARSALFTLAAVAGQGAHLLALAHVGGRYRLAQRHAWIAALLSGWGCFAVVAGMVTLLPLDLPLATALAVAALAAAWWWLPRVQGEMARPSIPPLELRLRLVAAFVLAAFILWSAPRFGPIWSGVLLSLPITGSIMPPFTLALYGSGALTRLVRGFAVGLWGFSAFFLVVAATVRDWGITAAFTAAVGAALAALFAANRLALRSRL